MEGEGAARMSRAVGPGKGRDTDAGPRCLQTRLITVSPQTTLPDALKLLAQHRVRHLPVVDPDGNLVGIVSDRDLKQAMASPATSLEAHELVFLLNRLRIGEIRIARLHGSGALARAHRCLPERSAGRAEGRLAMIQDTSVRPPDDSARAHRSGG
jgi:acetoin utilization protein AcuB